VREIYLSLTNHPG